MRFSPLCLSLLFAAACGVSATSQTPEPYLEYLTLSTQLTCETKLRCCGTLCSASNDSSTYVASQRLLSYVAAGLILYDSDAASACLKELSTRYTACDTQIVKSSTRSPCDRVLVPNGGEGSACETKIASCKSGSLCIQEHCVAQPKLNQSCVLGGVPCTTDSYCVRLSAVQEPSCTQAAQLGQPCSGRPCDTTQGLICLSSGTCALVQPEGGPCTANVGCMSGYCNTTMMVCEKAPLSPTVQEQLCTAP